VAIKGKTKRSQGRPMRRPATAPRPQLVERRAAWWRAPAFGVTIAVVVLAVTLLAAWNRTQLGWGRDDIRRFSTQLRAQTDQLTPVLGAGTKQLPGMQTAADVASGSLKPKDLQVRASGWSAKIGELSQKVANITVGTPEAVSSFDGTPVNNVGGRVPLLNSVRDAYTAAFDFYGQAATTYQAAGGASGAQVQQLLQQAQGDSAKAGQAMDNAAALLARVMVQYHLPVNQQLPGESSTAFGNRTGAVSSDPTQQLDPSQVPGATPVPPTSGASTPPSSSGNP
jgi:hypothetical protein